MKNTRQLFSPEHLKLGTIGIVFLSIVFLFFGSAVAKPSGPVLDLSNQEGKVVYVDFWASWCAPCKASFSYMNDLKAQYPETDFHIVLINLDQKPARAERFLRGVTAPVPSLYDPKGKIARQYKVSAMPTSVLIDRKGNIRYIHDGFHPEKTKEYSKHIEELLNE
jgi:thiol-disulfide isomerase/thioredoxin